MIVKRLLDSDIDQCNCEVITWGIITRASQFASLPAPAPAIMSYCLLKQLLVQANMASVDSTLCFLQPKIVHKSFCNLRFTYKTTSSSKDSVSYWKTLHISGIYSEFQIHLFSFSTSTTDLNHLSSGEWPSPFNCIPHSYSHQVTFWICHSHLVTSLLKAHQCYFFPIYLGTIWLLSLAHELSSLVSRLMSST